MLGQGGRCGGDPAGRVAEGNAGPAWLLLTRRAQAERRSILKTATQSKTSLCWRRGNVTTNCAAGRDSWLS
jgi:hypothetical protein